MPDLPLAACREYDPETFFGPHTCDIDCDGEKGCYRAKAEQGRFARIREAKTICQSCPEQAPCLAWALETDQPYGIWGGTTERERKNLRRNSAQYR